MKNYKKPPILEGIIELVPQEEFTHKDMSRLAKRLETKYAHLEEMHDFDVEVRVVGDNAHPGVRSKRDWYRLFSKDGADIAIVNRSAYATTRLAPYQGWSALIGKLVQNMDTFESTLGKRKWERIGVRYINRIDVPVKDDADISLSDYLNFFPSMPDGLNGALTAAAARIDMREAEYGLRVIISMTDSPAVLLNHKSFLLDIDVIDDGEIPVKREDFLQTINRIQSAKNHVFESIITDQARNLF